MVKYRVVVKNLEQAKEAQDLFFILGYEKDVIFDQDFPKLVITHEYSGWRSTGACLESFESHKLITLDQLRDMVKPKEYLDENFNLVYGSGVYEVPEGAEVAILYENGVVEFFKDDYKNCWHIDDHFWFDYSESPKFYKSGSVVWKRNNKCADIDKEDPFHLDVDTTLNQRQSQYGRFANVAATTQNLYDLTSRDDMSNVQREALHMICSKLARIANGDPNHVDSWHDIAGYATLVVQDLEQ